MGIEVLPPDVHRSHLEFTVEGDAIRFGLLAVKNVGQGAIESIIAAREEGGAVPLADRLLHPDRPAARQPQGPRGAGQGRRAQRVRPPGADPARARRRGRCGARRRSATGSRGQTSLFDLGAADADGPRAAAARRRPRSPVRERLRWEKELLGLYLSEHPMGEVAEQVGQFVTAYSGDLKDEIARRPAGRRRRDRDRRPDGHHQAPRRRWPSSTLEDLQGSIEVVVFPRLYETDRPDLARRRDPAGRRPGRPQGRGGLAARRPRGPVGRRGRPRARGVRPRGRGRRPGAPRRRQPVPGRPGGSASSRRRVGSRCDAYRPRYGRWAGGGTGTARMAAGRTGGPTVATGRSAAGPSSRTCPTSRRSGPTPEGGPLEPARRSTLPGSRRPSLSRRTPPPLGRRRCARPTTTSSPPCPTRPGRWPRPMHPRRPTPLEAAPARTAFSTFASAAPRRRSSSSAMETFRQLARERPGDTRVVVHVPRQAARRCRWS